MSPARHQIRRQVLQISCEDADAAARLQTELRRLYATHILPALDRCLSELCGDDRVLRFDCVQIDLGQLDPHNLADSLQAVCEPQLRQALAVLLPAGRLATGASYAAAEETDLELLSFFVRTGCLPWWADPRRDTAVADAVVRLLRQAPRTFCAWLRAICTDDAALRRLIGHCREPELLAMVHTLDRQAGHGAGELSTDLSEWQQALSLLRALRPSLPWLDAATWSAQIVAAMVRVAGGEPSSVAVRARPLWQTVWSRLASDLPREIAETVAARLPMAADDRPTGGAPASTAEPGESEAAVFASVPQRLGASAVTSAALAPDAAGNDSGHAATLAGRDQTAQDSEPDAASAAAERIAAQLRGVGSGDSAHAASLLQLIRQVAERADAWPRATKQQIAACIGEHPTISLRTLHRLFVLLHRAGQLSPEQITMLRQALAAKTDPSKGPGTPWAQAALDATSPQTPDGAHGLAAAGPSGAEDERNDEAQAERRILLSLLTVSAVDAAAEAGMSRVPQSEPARDARPALPARGAASGEGSAVAAAGSAAQAPATSPHRSPLPTARQTDAASQPQQPHAWAGDATGEPRSVEPAPLRRGAPISDAARAGDSGHSEVDAIDVQSAGIVFLWPLLPAFFRRLRLLGVQGFVSPAAQHRAVGLLQHVATSVASPAEYQVPLAKVLCGMDLAEVFSFGDPVCTEERDESLNLLAAVAQHVPALRERSPDELRAEIVQRSGVLSRGPGSWLLRVERHAEEDALDAVPWSMAWIKQPWMTTPLAVEW